MSTYNGEKYLKEQIDSLLSQKGVNVNILIRDDGSIDNTISMLREYSQKYDNIEYYSGHNLGPAYSFLDLMKKSKEADLYAFCDQDDVWDEDKLLVAATKLDELDSSKPIMYYSNLRIVDSELNYIRESHSYLQEHKCKYGALLEYMPTGCTVVFNEITRKFVNEVTPEYLSMHDIWMYVLCKMFGETIYDFESHISYRQHSNNVVGAYKYKTPKIYYEKFKRLFNPDFQPKFHTAKCLYNNYAKYMSAEDLEVVEELVHYKDGIRQKTKLLFDNRLKASSLSREVRTKILILFGIV